MEPITTFKKNISTFSLMMTGLTCIIGSGWLLSTQKISSIAGPAGIFAWIIGMVVASLVGLFFVEIGSCHPSAGGIGAYSRITHGRFCGFLTAWTNWLSIVAVPTIEAQAIIQYLSQLNPKMHALYDVPSHQLTHQGILLAIFILLFFMFINYWSVKLFIRFNNVFTAIKIIIPILTIVVLFKLGLHTSNFGLVNLHEFAPFGFNAVLASVISCGVIVSYNGFQTPLTFSEEIANPKRMLPIAVIGALAIAFIIFVLLQIVFIGALNPSQLANGWHAVNLRSPYVDLLMAANLHVMVLTLYVGSVLSPGVCGVAFTASCSRILYGLAAGKHLPQFLSVIHPKYHTPRNALIVSTVISCIFLFLFKGWYELVAVISVIHVISYLPAPVVTLANRKLHPEKMNDPHQFKMPFASILGPILIFILSILLFYTEWPLTAELSLLILPGLLFYFYYEWKIYGHHDFLHMLKGSLWFIFYLIALSAILYAGNNPHLTHPLISTPVSMLLLAALSLFTYYYGVKSGKHL